MRRKSWLLFAFLLFFIAACKSDDDIPEPMPQAWKAAEGFLYENRSPMNSLIWDDKLYVLTRRSVAETSPDGKAFHYFFSPEVDFPVPLTRDFFVAFEKNPGALIFIPTGSPNTSGAKRVRLSFDELGSGSGNFPLYQHLMAANSKGQVLIPLRDAQSKQTIFVFDVKTRFNNLFWNVDEVTYNKIELAQGAAVSRVNVIGDDFLVALPNGGTLKVKPDGTYQKVSDETIFNLLPLDNKIFGSGSNGLYVSENQGNSWTWLSNNFTSLGLTGLSSLQGYTTIGGKTVVYNTVDVSTVERKQDGSGYITSPIKLDGMEGHSIIKLHEWKNQVFAVTSTGVFMSSVEDFFAR